MKIRKWPFSLPSSQTRPSSTLSTTLKVHLPCIFKVLLIPQLQLSWFSTTELVSQRSMKCYHPILKTASWSQKCQSSRRLKSWLLVAWSLEARKISTTSSKKAGLSTRGTESTLKLVKVNQWPCRDWNKIVLNRLVSKAILTNGTFRFWKQFQNLFGTMPLASVLKDQWPPFSSFTLSSDCYLLTSTAIKWFKNKINKKFFLLNARKK